MNTQAQGQLSIQILEIVPAAGIILISSNEEKANQLKLSLPICTLKAENIGIIFERILLVY
jgi:hypothetical protein